jgi:hypothetical protein
MQLIEPLASTDLCFTKNDAPLDNQPPTPGGREVGVPLVGAPSRRLARGRHKACPYSARN